MITNEELKNPTDAIRAREAMITSLTEDMDSADFFTVISFLCDEDESPKDFLNSSLYKNLLHATQSNPTKTHEALIKIFDLDEEISIIDGGGI